MYRIGLLWHARGECYLISERGWLRLRSNSRIARRDGLVRVYGEALNEGEWLVERVEEIFGGASEKRPLYYDRPPENVFGASMLRSRVHKFMEARGYAEIMLPSAWHTAQECDAEELRVTHPHVLGDVVLLQSPQLPAYAAVSGGLDGWYSFARSWRCGPSGESVEASLFEFEQLVLGGVGVVLADLMGDVQDLFCELAATQGITVCEDEFRSVPVRTDSFGVGKMDPVSVLKVSTNMGRQARVLMYRRLAELGAHVTVLDEFGSTLYGEDAVLSSACERLVVQVAEEHFDEVERLFAAVRRALARSQLTDMTNQITDVWMPTWRILTTAIEKDSAKIGEGSGGGRAIAATRLGDDRCRAASLTVGGVNVAHVEEFSALDRFEMNLQANGLPHERFKYLLDLKGSAPRATGMACLGWEQLCAVILGTSPYRCQLFPRRSNGSAGNAQTPTIHS